MDVLAALQPLPTAKLVVGFSGGLDSTVLLHALAALPEARACGLRAIHIHHGLHANADEWTAHCERVCTGFGVPLRVIRVHVDRESGHGPEGAARAARLAAFRQALADEEVLTLAHHRDDQAETVLLRLLRGAGGDGLAGMRRRSRLGSLHLWRPLLDLPRAALRDYADAHSLSWIDDPSNADDRYDRNFIRERVLPLIEQRWQQAKRNLARSAALLTEQSQLLRVATEARLDALQVAPNVLDIPGLLAQPRAQRARVLRAWLQRLQGHPPPGSVLATIEQDLLRARHDSEARIDWADIALHRWRDRLYALVPSGPLPPTWEAVWDGRVPLRLPDGATLELTGAVGFDAPLNAHARRGGERIRLPGREHSHALKHVLQERDMPPWIRARLPLLFDADGELLAAGDAILAAKLDAWMKVRGAHLRWSIAGSDATSD